MSNLGRFLIDLEKALIPLSILNGDRTRRVTSKIKLLQRIKPVRNETTATKEHDN